MKLRSTSTSTSTLATLLILIWLLVVSVVPVVGQTQRVINDTQTATASPTTLIFNDGLGTSSTTMEVVLIGTAPATISVVTKGCGRSGTCSAALNTYTTVAPTVLTLNPSTPYDYYQVVISWTGGDGTTQVKINRLSAVAKFGGSASITSAAVIAAFTSCSGVQYLGADGACHAASGGFAAPTNWAKDGTNANDFVNTVVESVSGNQSLYKTTWTHTNASLASGNNIKGEDNSGTITVTSVANTTVSPFAYNIHTINLVSGNLTHAFEFVNRVTGKSTAGQQIDQLSSAYFSLGTSALAGPLPLARIVDIAADPIDTSVTIGEFDFLATGALAAPTGGGGFTTVVGIKAGDLSVANIGTNYCMICSGGTPTKKVSMYVYAGTPANLDNMAIFETGSNVQMKGGLMVSAAVNTVLGLFSGEDANDTFGVVVNGQNSFHFSYDGTGSTEWGICHAVSSSFCIRRPGAGVNDLVIDRTSGLIKMLNFGPVNMLTSSTAPTISSGFGTSPSIASNNGTGAFTVNVGTGGSATSGVIGLPAATNGWICQAQDLTTNSATVFVTKQTASSTTTATIGNFNTSGAAAAWVASDILSVTCHGR